MTSPTSGEPAVPTGPAHHDEPEQVAVRKAKRERILESGQAAYPNTVERTHTIAELRATYDGQELEPDTRTGQVVSVNGGYAMV